MPKHAHLPVMGNQETRIESQQRVWDGRFPLDVVRFRHRRFDGTHSTIRTWELWRRGCAAAVLPYDPDSDQVVLIEQFRLPALAAGLDPVLVELPAGLMDEDETSEQTARREMREEMDLPIRSLHRIGEFLLTPGGSDELCALYLGQVTAPSVGSNNIVGQGGLAAEQEDIQVRVWPATDAIHAALAGQFANSITTIGLLWLATRRDAMRMAWRMQ